MTQVKMIFLKLPILNFNKVILILEKEILSSKQKIPTNHFVHRLDVFVTEILSLINVPNKTINEKHLVFDITKIKKKPKKNM